MVKHNNQWGTVCDDNFSSGISTNARSACYTLGLNGGSAQREYTYTGSEPILMDDVDCATNTTNFLSCSHNGWGIHNCGSGENVVLTCT